MLAYLSSDTLIVNDGIFAMPEYLYNKEKACERQKRASRNLKNWDKGEGVFYSNTLCQRHFRQLSEY